MSNTIHDLQGEGEKYTAGNTSSVFSHDVEAVSTLRDILIELRKISIHLRYLSELDIENYNIRDSD